MNEAKQTFVYGMARTALTSNIVKSSYGSFLQAGGHQFRSLWTRDFCFATEGLIAIGEHECVRNHLQYLLDHLNSEYLVPRLLETGSSKRTVLMHTVLRFLPRQVKNFSFSRKPKPEYLGEHRTPSQDSNLLVILSALSYGKVDPAFLEKNKTRILKAFSYYDMHKKNALLWQQKYSDWQDSVEREGHSFYLNLLYWQVARLLTEMNWLQIDHKKIKTLLVSNFYLPDKSLFKSLLNSNVISLEGQLLALEWDFLDSSESQKIYQSIKTHPLWTTAELPGLCSYPVYSGDSVSWTTKSVGLRHYHDEMVWSWLIGKALKVSSKMKDENESNRIIEMLYKWVKRDGTIYEIYNPAHNLPFISVLYKSESPFSWGAGVILEALKAQS